MSANQVFILLGVILFGVIVTFVYKRFFGKDVKIVDVIVTEKVEYQYGSFNAQYKVLAGDDAGVIHSIKGDNVLTGVTITTIAYENQTFVKGMIVHYKIKKGEVDGAEIVEVKMPQA